ncbi:hypothetical protein GQ600_3180 [Phytophthora cactorum]|nr:hypothetical protein GQ600_3180 [Phytophthora cactorum]
MIDVARREQGEHTEGHDQDEEDHDVSPNVVVLHVKVVLHVLSTRSTSHHQPKEANSPADALKTTLTTIVSGCRPRKTSDSGAVQLPSALLQFASNEFQ